jgi:hypothetical protein
MKSTVRFFHPTSARIVLGALAVVSAVTLTLGGCTQSTVINGTHDVIASPSFSAGPVMPTERSLRAEDLVPPLGSRTSFAVLSGSRKGKTIEVSVERATTPSALNEDPTPSTDAESRVRIVERVERKPGDWRVSDEMLLALAADGATLVEVVTHGEDSISRFAKPLPFAGTLTPTNSLDGASPMEVVTISRGRSRGEGTATRSLKIIGECDVDVSGRKMRAVVVELNFEADLDVADAKFRAQLYVVPNEGVVAEVRHEDVLILGILPRRSDETVVRVERSLVPSRSRAPDSR